MPVKAGFAEIDITPPIGTHKIGMLRDIVSDSVLDPIMARVVVLEAGDERIGFVQLDTLCVRWSQTNDIRARIEAECSVPGDHVMVWGTHNHAGPAIANVGDVPRDDAYAETMVAKVVECFGQAVAGLTDADIGLGRAFEHTVPHNRRVVMRNGLVKTQSKFTPDALYLEGPVDPEVGVLFARKRGSEELLGAFVNFTCHPTHHGGGTAFSAGYPGCLAAELASRGCPHMVFANGASGNIIYVSQETGEAVSMEDIGVRLADAVETALEGVEFTDDVRLGARGKTLQLPFREAGEDEVAGRIPAAQRFVDTAIYDRGNPAVVEKIERMGTQPAEVQVLFVNDIAYAAIPAEYFVEYQLRIKLDAWPTRAFVVGHANGMIGYVPTKAAFERGGYETTFAGSSRMAPETGDLLADAAIDLIRNGA